MQSINQSINSILAVDFFKSSLFNDKFNLFFSLLNTTCEVPHE